MNVAYGCCVGSWEKLAANVIPRLRGRPLLGLSGQTSICKAYNTILDAYEPRGLDMLVLVHDDLEILDPNCETKFLAALAEPDVAMAGVCGGKGETSLAWWTSETVGHQVTDSGMLDFGPRTGDVAIVEGSIMAFGPWAIQHLRFDEAYPGFLGYDDICLTARKLGKRVVVADVDTHHHSTATGFKSAAVADDWYASSVIFDQKWNTPR